VGGGLEEVRPKCRKRYEELKVGYKNAADRHAQIEIDYSEKSVEMRQKWGEKVRPSPKRNSLSEPDLVKG